jgi:hypothetical protein
LEQAQPDSDGLLQFLFAKTDKEVIVAGQGNRRVKDEKEIVGPTPRRFGHGQVMRLERPIADAQGGVGRPWQTLDTLARMERQGSITAPMRRAGNRFHDDFRLASLDPLFAGDPTRIPVQLKSSAAVRPHDWGNEAARLSVVSALDALGGLHSPGGACAWQVLGCETTIEKWALTSGWANRRITRDMAAGILVSALGILKAHYGL